MGKPVIVNGGWGDVEEIFGNDDIGFLVDDAEDQDTHSVIRAILKGRPEETVLRQFAIERAGLAFGITQLNLLYQKLAIKELRSETERDLKTIGTNG